MLETSFLKFSLLYFTKLFLHSNLDLYDFRQMEAGNNSFALKPKTGTVAKVNNTKIALFRFADTVHAIDEKCPHLG